VLNLITQTKAKYWKELWNCAYLVISSLVVVDVVVKQLYEQLNLHRVVHALVGNLHSFLQAVRRALPITRLQTHIENANITLNLGILSMFMNCACFMQSVLTFGSIKLKLILARNVL